MADNNAYLLSCLFLISFFIFILLINSIEAQKVPAVFVFGDSLVDVGNNNHLDLSLARANFAHNGIDFPLKKATGRFSNGRNTADFLAEKLGLPTSPPYLSLASRTDKTGVFLTGVSFASGGAGIFNGTDQHYRQSLPLTKQVEYYANVHEELVEEMGSNGASDHLSKSIFFVVIGSNDIFGYPKRGRMITPQEYVDQMVFSLEQHLKEIHNLGGRKFILTGIGPVGCCPAQRKQSKTEECNEEANYLADEYNSALKIMLQQLKSELKDIHYTYYDTYTLFLSFIQKPADYGFVEVEAACCGLGNLNAKMACVPFSKYCSNRSDHLFWDFYHPTEAAANILVNNLFDGSSKYTFPMNVMQLVAI